MKNFLEKFKNGIIFGIGFLVAIVIGVFAYQFTEYQNIEDVDMGQTLTKDTFNQLLANVRDLNGRVNTINNIVNTLSGNLTSNLNSIDSKITTLSGVLATKGSRGSDITLQGSVGLNNGTGTYLKTNNVLLNKGTYLVYFRDRGGLSTVDATFVDYLAESDVSSDIQLWGVDRVFSNGIPALPKFTEVPFVLKVKKDNTNVRFVVVARIGLTPSGTISYINLSAASTFVYVQITD